MASRVSFVKVEELAVNNLTKAEREEKFVLALRGRETKIWALICEGKSYREIAKETGIKSGEAGSIGLRLKEWYAELNNK